MKYFLGVDAGGTKTHALVADEGGQALGFGLAGPGSWEAVGYEKLTQNLIACTTQAIKMARVTIQDVGGAGFGLAGYDWPSQKNAHLDAVQPIKLVCPTNLVNDATLGILAGAEEGWGVSVVSGTGCNCRAWSKDYKHEGRVVGGAPWSGEAAGAFDIVLRAMQAIAFEWDRRGPATHLTPAFIDILGARDLDDLIEGMYIGKYGLNPNDARLVFHVAADGDPAAMDVIRWAGDELGQMACAVIRQLHLENESFDVVMIGSLFDGHPLMGGTMGATIHALAPGARLVRLNVPPVVGGVILGMQTSGLDARRVRSKLIETTHQLLDQIKED
jgi:N-acetylglucosamine kinase-like BadF-type ATPase